MAFGVILLAGYSGQSRAGKMAPSCPLGQPITARDLGHLARTRSQPYNNLKYCNVLSHMYPCYLVATFEFSYQYHDNPRKLPLAQITVENGRGARKTSHINPSVGQLSCMSPHTRLLNFATFYAVKSPKTTNKNIQQRTLPGFITISSATYAAKRQVALSDKQRQVLVDGEFRSRRSNLNQQFSSCSC